MHLNPHTTNQQCLTTCRQATQSIVTLAKGEGIAFGSVCLSACLSVSICLFVCTELSCFSPQLHVRLRRKFHHWCGPLLECFNNYDMSHGVAAILEKWKNFGPLFL